MDKRKYLRWIAPALLPLIAAVGMLLYALVIQARSNAILLGVSALKAGVSSVAEVEALSARHTGDLRERYCSEGECRVSFEIYNTWLYRLRVEPLARFWALVTVKEGVVDFIGVRLSRDTRVFPTSPSAGMTDEYRTLPKQLSYLTSPYSFPTPVGKPYLRVALTVQASPEQRQHAYAYSLKCLIKPGWGCDLPCDYLPLAWNDWQAELKKHQFGADGFGDYYPNRQRCK